MTLFFAIKLLFNGNEPQKGATALRGNARRSKWEVRKKIMLFFYRSTSRKKNQPEKVGYEMQNLIEIALRLWAEQNGLEIVRVEYAEKKGS